MTDEEATVKTTMLNKKEVQGVRVWWGANKAMPAEKLTRHASVTWDVKVDENYELMAATLLRFMCDEAMSVVIGQLRDEPDFADIERHGHLQCLSEVQKVEKKDVTELTITVKWRAWYWRCERGDSVFSVIEV